MPLLIDFIPIVVFFMAYKAYGIYAATVAAIVLSFVQMLWKRARLKRFDPVSLSAFLAITLLGGATLLFRNAVFIQWKPTVIYWIMSLAFLITPWVHSETLVQKMFRKVVYLHAKQWMALNWIWVLFLGAMGMLNLYVAYHYSTDTWVHFKLFGTLGITLLFLVGQGLFMVKYGTLPTHTLTEATPDALKSRSSASKH